MVDQTLCGDAGVAELVIATEPESLEPMRSLARASCAAELPRVVVRGGAIRDRQSVYEGLRALRRSVQARARSTTERARW